MPTNYPTSLDTLTNPTAGSTLATHVDQHSNANDAIEALQAKLGTNTTAASLPAGAVLGKASGTGLRVDTSTPAWGWRDLTADITVRGTGAADPTFAVYGATALRAFQFSATVMQEVFLVFHVPHDWVPGSDIFIHAHWSNAAAAPNTGTVRWGFEYSFAKGFDQEAFPTPTIVYAQQASSATRYRHMVTETTAVTIATMEVDGLILMRAFRDAANAADTCTDAVFLHTVDIHYQSTNMATAGKAPSFYA